MAVVFINLDSECIDLMIHMIQYTVYTLGEKASRLVMTVRKVQQSCGVHRLYLTLINFWDKEIFYILKTKVLTLTGKF